LLRSKSKHGFSQLSVCAGIIYYNRYYRLQ